MDKKKLPTCIGNRTLPYYIQIYRPFIKQLKLAIRWMWRMWGMWRITRHRTRAVTSQLLPLLARNWCLPTPHCDLLRSKGQTLLYWPYQNCFPPPPTKLLCTQEDCFWFCFKNPPGHNATCFGTEWHIGSLYTLTYSMEQSPSWEANWFCS